MQTVGHSSPALSYLLTAHDSLLTAARSTNQTETPRQSRGVSDVFDDCVSAAITGADADALPHVVGPLGKRCVHARSAVSTHALPQDARPPNDALPAHTHAHT
jgi:hypothetical protein